MIPRMNILPARLYRWIAKRLPTDKMITLYPPLRAMGVKTLQLDTQFRRARFLLPLNWKSRNTGGTMFGGNQASLADPVAALACLQLFPDHDVFTRTLQLDFIAPGDSDLELRFDFPAETEEQIRGDLERVGRSNPQFHYAYYTRAGTKCTQVFCEVAIRPNHYHASKIKK